VPQHALLAGGGHAARGPRPVRLPRSRDRTGVGGDPWWHRRLAADGDGRALPQPLHRDARDPRPPRMDQRAGHGRLGEALPQACGTRGARLMALWPAARPGYRRAAGPVPELVGGQAMKFGTFALPLLLGACVAAVGTPPRGPLPGGPQAPGWIVP